MLVGATITFTETSADPATVARLVEERGLESLFVTEHTHEPVDRIPPRPDGSPTPAEHLRALDPLVALTAAAGATGHLRLGTAVLLLAHRDPIVTAKAIASLDQISGGRVVVGVGAGWIPAEAAHHGLAFATRFDVLREHIGAMRALWTGEPVSYAGRHVSLLDARSLPTPHQRPGPPILIGGDGPRVLERVLRDGDGWLPRVPADPARLRARLAELARRSRARDLPVPPVTVYGARAEDLPWLRDAGVTRALLRLPSASAREIERALDAAT